MFSLPSAKTPLNQHSLLALETWLKELGAQQSSDDPCLWVWVTPQWRAEIRMEQDDLMVIWFKGDNRSKYSFPYGLSRRDIENAIFQGP